MNTREKEPYREIDAELEMAKRKFPKKKALRVIDFGDQILMITKIKRRYLQKKLKKEKMALLLRVIEINRKLDVLDRIEKGSE